MNLGRRLRELVQSLLTFIGLGPPPGHSQFDHATKSDDKSKPIRNVSSTEEEAVDQYQTAEIDTASHRTTELPNEPPVSTTADPIETEPIIPKSSEPPTQTSPLDTESGGQMPITASDMTTPYVEVASFSSVSHALEQVTRANGTYDQNTYIVVDMENNDYAVFQAANLVYKLIELYGDPPDPSPMGLSLDGIEGLLDFFKVSAVDSSTGDTKLRVLQLAVIREKSKPKELRVIAVPVVDGNKLVGILAQGTDRDAVAMPADWISAARSGASSQPGGTLGAGSAPTAPAEAAPADDLPTDPRFVNIELLNDDYEKLNPQEKPLEVASVYTLSFFVDSTVSEFNITERPTNLDTSVFDAGQEDVLLTVQLESDDFEIDNNVQNLRVPRTGKSKKARFDIKPQKNGPATINAVILKDGAFVQVITLRFHVGPLFTSETVGREIDAAPLIRSRDLNITILETVGGYQMIMSGPVGAMAKLPISKAHLHSMIGTLRNVLLKQVVYLKASGVNIYQSRVKIPKGVGDHTLPVLANAGSDLFYQLFYGPGHDTQARLMGDRFREMAAKGKLNIQIFAQDFTMPWGLLYLGDNPDNPDPEMFLGLKHVIEHIPLQPEMQVTERAIDTSGGFKIGLNVNRDIDTQMNSEIIGRQLAFWENLASQSTAIKIEVRESAADVAEALNDGETEDSFLYFYCHAESYNLREEDKGGPDASKLIMTGHQELTLRKLSRNRKSLAGKPLVFINACESAEMSPEFYDGFVPYFVNKGARGVIGTEVETPALFAEEWANRFFPRFLAGDKNLGELFLELRREFYFDDGNILGLLYALYSDGDTYISDGVLS